MATDTYRHSQVYGTMWLLVPLSTLGGGLIGYASGDPSRHLGLAVLLGAGVLLLLVFGRLWVQISKDSLHWGFGYLGLPRWKLALADITRVEKCQVNDVLGSGIKKVGGHWLYSAGGSHGVRLSLKDGRQLRLGSDEHERLAALLATRIAKP